MYALQARGIVISKQAAKDYDQIGQWMDSRIVLRKTNGEDEWRLQLYPE